jgi:hypothetical protein
MEDKLEFSQSVLTSGGSPCHLNRNAASERSSTSRVLYADHADIALACNSTRASLVRRDGDIEGEISLLVVVVAPTGIALDVGGNRNRRPRCTSARSIDHGDVRAGTVTINLVEGHHDHATGGDLRKNAAV